MKKRIILLFVFFVILAMIFIFCNYKLQKKEHIEPIAEINFVDSGVYTFYNEEANCYLSCEGKILILNETPHKWTLKQVEKKGFNICAQDTSLLLDIDNAHITVGTTIKVWKRTGYDVQIWNINRNTNGTYSILYSGNDRYCLGFDDGSAVLQIRDKNNSMQEWKVVDVSDSLPKEYLAFTSKNNIVELQLPLDITKVISKTRLQQWANDLETAYYSFYELTNFIPYNKIIVEAYKPSKYIGWVIDNSNIIHIDNKFIYEDLRKMAARECDWNFCALHEMGHMFDSKRPWNFEAELMTDLKLAYVLEKNNVAAAPSEFNASTFFYGKDIIKAYNRLGSDFSKTYNIFGCAERFLEIKEDIGWEPFKQAFHYLQEKGYIYSYYSKSKKLEKFVEVLSVYSNKDIKGYFSSEEWNTILDKCKNN